MNRSVSWSNIDGTVELSVVLGRFLPGIMLGQSMGPVKSKARAVDYIDGGRWLPLLMGFTVGVGGPRVGFGIFQPSVTPRKD